MPQNAVPSLIGLELNSSCVRAVSGGVGCSQVVSLSDAQPELPLALSLEGRTPEVGVAGFALCRQNPHLACLNFLPHLGDSQEWTAGRHRLDSAKALALAFEQMRGRCGSPQGVVVAVPSYLSPAQMGVLAPLAAKAQLPLIGSIPIPLAATLAAYAERTWSGLGIIVDVDEHALSFSAVSVEGDRVQFLTNELLPQLSQRVWKDRLLNLAADRCVRQTRRDPRDSASAEQLLYDQLDGTLENCRQGQITELAVQGANWCQNLLMRPDEIVDYCTPLVRQALEGMHPLLQMHGLPSAMLVTFAAGRLPGMVVALEHNFGQPGVTSADDPPTDFGDYLIENGPAGPSSVHLLSADAIARAAHSLAARFFKRELQRGHLDTAPLPQAQPPDAGPARLVFRGQEYALNTASFTLGRHSSCSLVFETSVYPTVSSRHCEIAYDRRGYVLIDRSLNGTLVNDRPVVQQIALHPGDWIRLGQGGPLLQFLGQGVDQKKRMTRA